MLFKDKKITIMGLGLHGGGVGIAGFFCGQGANVLVTDLKTEGQLRESIEKLKKFDIRYTLGKHELKDFTTADLIIKNPDVPDSSPYLEIARKNNIKIETDINLFFELSGAFIIGVTGTKGKSTTASLIYYLLKAKYPRTFLAGNIGVSPLELLSKIKKGDRVVLELSSFELESLRKSPNIAVITNILPDHLNRYKGMADYISAKEIIFKYQNEKDILVLNYDDKIVNDFSKKIRSKYYFYSLKDLLKEPGKIKNSGCFLKGDDVFFKDGKKPIINLKDFKLKGEHNISNLLAAVSVAKLIKISSDSIKKSVKSFKGVHSRQELVREFAGIKYFNDTTATMPDAVIAAIRTFTGGLILICGGQDKNLNYANLADEINKKVKYLFILPGTASDKIIKELLKINSKIPVIEVSSMENAVKEANKKATKGDIVLLSPGAASFNLFKNEFDRGEQFKKSVKKLR
ncbi:MAG: UDP-N-acetylmuramoyl-L-alanine--D-glutamate ligase [Candidatus Staskawiczbacteria bacterium]|nr:UDP-N-acetylmuramoyl-L-alanine--D-glutamate ligase [Candidatus Staskawiczbacteria bacterium]